MTTLDTPLAKEPVIGRAVAKLLERDFDMRTVGDLLYHFPRRYEERGELTDLASLEVGTEVTVLARVEKAVAVPMRDRPEWLVRVDVGDGKGTRLSLTFFAKNQKNAQWRASRAKVGQYGLFAGTVGSFKGNRQLTHPAWQMIDSGDEEETVEEFAGGLIPVYPASKDLRTWQISRVVRLALAALEPPPDPLPATIKAGRSLLDLRSALQSIHRPDSYAMLQLARERLKWDEALAVQIALLQRRARSRARPATPRPRREGGLLAEFDAALSYRLTDGQREVGAEIAADLAGTHPMHRLLQGEVGSGKTLCALRAMLQVVDAGAQAALLAPTEVLAGQHARSIRDLLGPIGRGGELDAAEQATQVVLVTGSQGAAVRRQALAKVAAGSAGIVIGTHALLYDGVEFPDLGLVVVDEQHRFGVQQRDALRTKAATPPHVLVMTATPIPRTVAMTVFGDLDTSTLTELPAGRAPITSHVVPAAEKPAYLDRAWTRLREEVERGHQGYVVCPRTGGNAGPEDAPDGLDGPDGPDGERGRRAGRPPIAVAEVAPRLAAGPLDGLRVGVLHGRLPGDEKDAVMRSFAAGKLDVLVSTTVIEVGVDVPNATVMIVLDADRFGVSQLHQLRGRVGRGSAPGLCLLVTDAPDHTPARQRLDAVASTLDGFQLARLDLELRREGDVLGEAQSGRGSHLRLLSLLRDEDLIADARTEAQALLDGDETLTRHPALAAAVAARVDQERAEFLDKN